MLKSHWVGSERRPVGPESYHRTRFHPSGERRSEDWYRGALLFWRSGHWALNGGELTMTVQAAAEWGPTNWTEPPGWVATTLLLNASLVNDRLALAGYRDGIEYKDVYRRA